MRNGRMGLLKEPKQRKLLFSAGISWMFDAMDVGMISFVVAALAAEWSLSSQQVGILTSTTSIGMVFGAAMAGFLADKYGRKNILLWTLLIFSIASALSALATGFIMLCLLRFIAGFGLGESFRWPPPSFRKACRSGNGEEQLSCLRASGLRGGSYPH